MEGVTLMTLNRTDLSVGERIRDRRKLLGKSQRVVAGLAGIDHGTLGRWERGETPGDNRIIIANIARALSCSSDYLTGVAVPGGRHGAETAAAAHATIRSLITADLEFPTDLVQLQPVEALTAAVDEAIVLRQACDYAALTRQLPELINHLYAATGGPDRQPALRMLVRVAEAASFAVRYTGQPAGANIAADRARQAALLTEDPVLIAFGEWARAHAALGCGLNARAAQIAERGVRDLTAAPAAPGREEMLGMLYLTTAFGLVGDGRTADAVAPLTEATMLAQHTGETSTFALMFGPTNVDLWRFAIKVDAGDPIDAMDIAGHTNALLIPSASRQATFYVDQGRCLGLLGDVDRAVRAIETAERIAKQRVHGDPLVVETVRGLLERARRRAVGERLRGLVERVGVTA